MTLEIKPERRNLTFGSGEPAEPEHTQYKVTISEDVKLVEFLERYEILDTEGEIYTIREVIPDA